MITESQPPSFTALLPSVMCLCLLPGPLGGPSPAWARVCFDFFLWSRSAVICGPRLPPASFSCFYPGKGGALEEKEAPGLLAWRFLCSFVLVSICAFDHECSGLCTRAGIYSI